MIFVVDGQDRDRMGYDASGLRMIVESPELREAVILIMANKQDLPGALSVQEISEVLDLDANLATRHYHIQGCSVVTQDGINDGLVWLHDALLQTRPSLSGSSSSQPPPPPPPDESTTSSNELTAEEQQAKRLEELLLEWLDRDDIPPDMFLQHLEDATLDIWDHYTHLRIAWLFMTRHGRRVGMDKIFHSIESFIERSPRTKRKDTSRGTTFHATMTYFWVHMVHYAMSTMQYGSVTQESSSIELKSTSGDDALQKFSADETGESSSTLLKRDNDETAGFKRFLLMNPQLVNGGLFLHYYSKKRMLMNAEARSSVLLPDLRQLPSLLLDVVEKSTDSTPAHLRLQPRAPLSDVDFLVAVKQNELRGWGHDIFIRLLYLMLADQKKNANADEARKRDVDEIFKVLRHVQGNNFHLTLNYFWIQMVSYLMVTVRKKGTGKVSPEVDETDFETFYRQPDCQCLRNQMLYDKYYSRSLIDSQEAIDSFVLPNIKQLPSVL